MPIYSFRLQEVDDWKKTGYLVQRIFGYFLTHSKIMGPFKLIIHLVQNTHAGEQEIYWDKKNKGITILNNVSLLFVFYQCVPCSLS